MFVGFVAAFLFVGLYKSKGEETHSEHGAADYFLAGRGLTWWLIGFSLIAANISVEQFVGMSGQCAGQASYRPRIARGYFYAAQYQREGRGALCRCTTGPTEESRLM